MVDREGFALGHATDDLWKLPNTRRNLTLLVLDGFVFALGMSFLSPASILPVFVARLSPIDLLAGSFTAIEQIGIAIPQFVASRWAERAARAGRRRWLKATANLVGRAPLAVAILVLLTFGDRQPHLLVATVMVAFALLRLCDGAGVPAYYDVVGTTIHPRLRPRYFAWQQIGTALGGIIGALCARWLLASMPFPWNFATSFSVGLLLGVVVALGFLLIKEPSPAPFEDARITTNLARAIPWWASIRQILTTDQRFRGLVIARSLIAIGGMAPAYYTVSAVRRLQATDADAAAFGVVTLVSQLIGTLIWGEITARTRRPWFLVAGPAIGILGTFAAFEASSTSALLPALVAMGMSLASQLMCDMSLPIQLAEHARGARSAYVASYNLLIILFSVVAPVLGGVLASTVGYDSINLLGGITYVGAAIAGFSVLRLFPSPRGHMKPDYPSDRPL